MPRMPAPAPRPGRPRGFDAGQALEAAMRQFWRHGYLGTSLDDLTAAMGIGRSSFYAVFGSKRQALLEALTLYGDRLCTRVQAAADAAPDPRQAVLALLEGIACTEAPSHGCLFVNSASELAPGDAAVLAFGRTHMARIDALLLEWLHRLGIKPARARRLCGTLVAMAIGAITLRKAGMPERDVRAALGQATVLVDAALAPAAGSSGDVSG